MGRTEPLGRDADGMHVCMVLPDAYPHDVRVAKEARALVDAGHEVTLLCRARPGEPREAAVDGVRVVRIPTETPRERAAYAASALRNLLTNVHAVWGRELDSLLRNREIDAVHVHDLPLVETALGVAEGHGVPVVADLHENYPEAVRHWRAAASARDLLLNPFAVAERAIKPIPRYKRFERACVARAARTVAVVEEGRRHYVEDCGADPERVHVVSNTVDLDEFDPAVAPIDPHDEFTATYVGNFSGHRGLDTAVGALADAPGVRLVLVGKGPIRDDLEYRARRTGVLRRVTFTGWVDFDDVPGHVAAADVCLVPHAKSPHTETTVPHKLFQYMALSKPVIATDVGPLERIVEETGAGVVVPAGDEAAMAAALARLRDDPDLRAELGENGRRAVEGTYNWERDAERLLDMYAGL